MIDMRLDMNILLNQFWEFRPSSHHQIFGVHIDHQLLKSSPDKKSFGQSSAFRNELSCQLLSPGRVNLGPDFVI